MRKLSLVQVTDCKITQPVLEKGAINSVLSHLKNLLLVTTRFLIFQVWDQRPVMRGLEREKEEKKKNT